MSSPDWVREALASTRLLSNLSDELMDQLATSFVERTYQKDEAIFHQGDPGDALFVIASGQVRVEKEILDGTPVTLALRGPGAVIGELALLDGAPRSATVYALEMVKGLSLARSSFITFLGDNNEALKSLLGILSQRLRVGHFAFRLRFCLGCLLGGFGSICSRLRRRGRVRRFPCVLLRFLALLVVLQRSIASSTLAMHSIWRPCLQAWS